MSWDLIKHRGQLYLMKEETVKIKLLQLICHQAVYFICNLFASLNKEIT
jgi:hypothetical protein